MAQDPTVGAHLRDKDGFSPPIARFAPSPDCGDAIQRFWVPVWSLPAGQSSVQRVLQHPCCQLVIADTYAQLVGPRVGLSTKELSGSGWAFGAMLQPAVGLTLFGGPLTGLVDQDLDLARVTSINTDSLIPAVRSLLADSPTDATAQTLAAGLVEAALRPLLPIDSEGQLVNALVAYVESKSDLSRVETLAKEFAVSERTLLRITRRRIGLSPKWLIQRRRLHQATERIKGDPQRPLVELAMELGYADQAHFARDYRRVTGLRPSELIRQLRSANQT